LGRTCRFDTLAAFTHFGPGTTPLSVNHQGLFVSSTISFNMVPGKSLSDAVAVINETINRLGVPATIHGSFQGTARAFQASVANEPILILAALVTIYIVLGVLYESYVHPITILSTLPSAGVGGVLALMLFGAEFNIIALVGVILLIGIVCTAGGTRTRHDDRGCDLPCLSSALSSDHDDNGGGHGWRVTIGTGPG
jgi:multidrug efflux pump